MVGPSAGRPARGISVCSVSGLASQPAAYRKYAAVAKALIDVSLASPNPVDQLASAQSLEKFITARVLALGTKNKESN